MDNSLKATFFDVDGVIFESFEEIFAAVNEALMRFGGRPIEKDWYQTNSLGTHLDFLRSRGIDESVDMEEFSCYLQDRYLYYVPYHQFREGVREVIEFIHERKVPIHLASACTLDITQSKIDYHFGSSKLFRRIHGGEKKSEVFLGVMREYNLRPDQILFVTDMPRDIDEALMAGIDCNIAIISDFSTREQFKPYGCPVVEDHHKLLQLIRGMF